MLPLICSLHIIPENVYGNKANLYRRYMNLISIYLDIICILNVYFVCTYISI